ncbi:MAG: hypothetical protein KGR26_14175, partial [Cyanobacteria bacterium REEB65]|nr:hypothetical protein [Cyanobacteria bacterium REEB65]
PDEKVFDLGLRGGLNDFHRLAMEDRKRFGYPPFSLLVKIAVEGKKADVSREMARIQGLLSPLETDIFPVFTSAVRGKSIIHGLLKADPRRWPDMALVEKLRSLPPSVSVKVDPASLL